MHDVIVIGAGGGGAVVAKELAAHGLDVLVLEAGPRHLRPEKQWRHLENDANNPVSGYFRWGPADRSQSEWLRETPQNCFVWQLSGVGGTTQHYYGNCPRAVPGVFRGYRGKDRRSYDRAHEFPFSYRTLVPYYEWVEHTLPVQTAAMGTKEETFLRAASKLGLPRGAHRTRGSSCIRRRAAARSAATASRAASSRATRRATCSPSARRTTATSRWR